MIDSPSGNTIQHRISYRPPTWWERHWLEVLGCAGVWVLFIAVWIGFGG